ncbi:hypothetical protein WR25_17133 [Diploscapter pachys]|uniref:beta-mannosidase n=1 Tax=Diploscapter pachys TaxID=2018661 RepID=A0A2A2JGI8_9BILA|nr:hypothetical protein WR25_17133 [Diploscapter pachys]
MEKFSFAFFSLATLVFIATVNRSEADSSVIDLGGEWSFASSNKTITGTGKSDKFTVASKRTVPGDIYTDLFNNKIIDDPLYGDNHLFTTWISSDDWSYSRRFNFDMQQLNKASAFLITEGLDTIAAVSLNGKQIAQSSNQFVSSFADITKLLQDQNTIQVDFKSPVQYAAQMASAYKTSSGHDVPPVCPPSIQHGDCHPNFLRKAQYSFSWDWGPSFPTIGISQPIRIAVVESVYFRDFTWTTQLDGNFWNVNVETLVLNQNENSEVVWIISIDELGVEMEFVRKIREGTQMTTHQMQVKGKRQVNIYLSNQRRNGIVEMTKKIGFKTVDLVQDYVDPNKVSLGRDFYFRINGVPIFLKGSNWIPISMFPLTGNYTDRLRFLLDSAAEVGMNALRVWGGGLYETEEFYNYASTKGILIWQDLMFACALYPTNKEFLDSVQTEMQQQIWRLRKHASILVYAGNNENEIAIRDHWWSVSNYSEAQEVSDYVALYADTISPIVRQSDPSRPFLLSSPSNGIQTEM